MVCPLRPVYDEEGAGLVGKCSFQSQCYRRANAHCHRLVAVVQTPHWAFLDKTDRISLHRVSFGNAVKRHKFVTLFGVWICHGAPCINHRGIVYLLTMPGSLTPTTLSMLSSVSCSPKLSWFALSSPLTKALFLCSSTATTEFIAPK